MKKLFKFIFIAVFSVGIIINCTEVNTVASPEEGKKVEEFISKNENRLSSENITTLRGIIEKLNKYEVISQEERDYIRECEISIIREKLGDAQFEEYKKLIERRGKEVEFPQHERLRLYELEKLLND